MTDQPGRLTDLPADYLRDLQADVLLANASSVAPTYLFVVDDAAL